jgi:hypothetical protein
MIGVTVDPAASGVSIAARAVWNPESLSRAAAAPVKMTAAATAVSGTSTSLFGLRIFAPLSPLAEPSPNLYRRADQGNRVRIRSGRSRA